MVEQHHHDLVLEEARCLRSDIARLQARDARLVRTLCLDGVGLEAAVGDARLTIVTLANAVLSISVPGTPAAVLAKRVLRD